MCFEERGQAIHLFERPGLAVSPRRSDDVACGFGRRILPAW